MIRYKKILLIYILILLNGCEYGSNAVNLPLEVELKNNDICLYTKYKRSFLNEDDENDWFMVYANRSDNTKEKNYEKK
ncbi:hypothetical protein [Acinetobacter puyangensis]|uniref:hypothetical protein n=1 Tax=Acinetobacter puyangensis TaxID=1096779 RepID=UPI003A4DCD6A